MTWSMDEMRDPRKLQGILAEFVACMGTESILHWIIALSYVGEEEEEE